MKKVLTTKPVKKVPTMKPDNKISTHKPIYKYPSRKPAKKPTQKPVHKSPFAVPSRKPSKKPAINKNNINTGTNDLSTQSTDSIGLSTGAYAGIAIGGFVLMALSILGYYYIVKSPIDKPKTIELNQVVE